MMSRRGNLFGATRVSGPEISTDENGLDSLTETWRCNGFDLLNLKPRINRRHGEFTKLACKEVDARFLRTGLGEWTATFRGISSEPPEDIWSIESTAGQEDIRSFINFEEIAGTPDEPLNGAFFEDGIFQAFGPAAPDNFRGITSFLAPSVVVSVVRYSTSIPTGGALVGKIDVPGGPLAAPNSSGDQNFLKIGFLAEEFGEFWQAQESWLRSGDNGWNPEIYGDGG